jgi:hypothetical protein
MTWLSPIPLFPEAGADESALWPVSLPARRISPSSNSSMRQIASRPMPSVSAGPIWRWSSDSPVSVAMDVAPAPLPIEPAHVRIPAELLRRMSREAQLAGKSESEVWAEAARAWLQRRERDDDLPPTPPAAAQPCPRRERAVWVAIDALLVDLRARSREPTAA